MIPIHPRLCLKLLEANSLLMPKRSFSRLHTWRAVQLQYQKATQRLADRATHAQLSEEVMQVKRLADEKHKSIGILQSSGETLRQKISDLSAKREALLAELNQVEEALSQAQ